MSAVAAEAVGTLPGSQFPLGATVTDTGTNFAVASAVADGMLLCLFDAAGLGASHQTGWTGLVADLIRRRHGEVPSVGDVIRILARQTPS